MAAMKWTIKLQKIQWREKTQIVHGPRTEGEKLIEAMNEVKENSQKNKVAHLFLYNKSKNTNFHFKLSIWVWF